MNTTAQYLLGAALIATCVLESATFHRFKPSEIGVPRFHDDVRIGKELDALCPGQMLYNIPPMTFPDDCRWPRVEPYDNLRLWLHTSKVSFSFGQATNQLSAFDNETAKQLISGRIDFDRIAAKGYWGVLLMRKFAPDSLDTLVSNIHPVAVSPDFVLIRLKPPPPEVPSVRERKNAIMEDTRTNSP